MSDESTTRNLTEDGTLTIPFVPRVAQKLILNRLANSRIVTAVCHRRMGKTMFAVYWLIIELLKLGQEGKLLNPRGYYFCPTQKQAKIVAWDYFKYLLAELSIKKMCVFNETELTVALPNGAKIFLGSAEAIEQYRGIYVDRIVMDELASWRNAEYAYSEVLRPAMADRLAHGLIIGTVKGLDKLYEFYQMGQDKSLTQYDSLILPARVTDLLPPGELEELERTMAPDAFNRELNCDFFAESPDVLITPKEAAEAAKRENAHISLKPYPIVFGYDVAQGGGGDHSVLTIRRGPNVLDVHKWNTLDDMEQAAKVSMFIRQLKPQNVYIDAGGGSGVISRLNQLGHDDVVQGVFFNQSSPDPACVNMRAYMYLCIKRWLAYGSIPNDEMLIKDLVNQFLDDDPNNRVKLVKKQKIKEILSRSPDDSDSLALTFAGGEEEELYLDSELQNMTAKELSEMSVDRFKQLIGITGNTDAKDDYDPTNWLTGDDREEENEYSLFDN